MRIYELLTGLSTEIKGCIWCTDGSFVSPRNFKKSGKKAYGYALNDKVLVSLRRYSGLKYKWSSELVYTGAVSSDNGYQNSKVLKSIASFRSSTYPAVHKCLGISNVGIASYMPSIGELYTLNTQMITGEMRDNLSEAEILDDCNYAGPKWGLIWSSTEADYNEAWYIGYYGTVKKESKDSRRIGSVIPFFKIR